MMPARTSPVPARGQPCRRRRRKAQPPVGGGNQRVGALVDDDGATPPCRLQRALGLGSGQFAEQPREFAFVRREDRVLALQPLGVAQMADCVSVDDLRRLAGQRQCQHLRNVAKARADEQAADPPVVDVGRVQLDDRLGQLGIGSEVLTRT